MNTLPKFMQESHDADWYQEVADRIEARSGSIDWTASGPKLGSLNVSFMFMYPPIFSKTTLKELLQ